MRMKRTMAALAGATLALSLAACGDDDGGDSPATVEENPEFESGTTMAELAEAGTVTIGTKFDQPGFGLLGLGDEPEGFDVEVAKIIAGALGIAEDDIDWEESPSELREQLIEDGTVDFVVATYTINDERKQRISFAGPYYNAGQMLMVQSDNDTITGPDDLKANPDQKVCSVTGSTPAENIKQYLANADQLVLFDVYDKCADAMEDNQVQVVTTDNVILAGFVSESDGEFKLVGEQFTEEPYGIGIKKGDVEFCEFINQTLQENEDAYLEAWDSTAGQIEGTERPELPEPDPCT
ncbi:glutamate ABC transporter substrate-binding protein [Nocardioides caldifontis]|uniref:glutamate ABC transporter substrate-binding protein n=1 Tax=Nocardioides caldifontis TaxID=2588938 RepID=UPI0011DFA8F4|nr:glutamate ABC transporter substrate-binding protein [Nocardioides caldifontis]